MSIRRFLGFGVLGIMLAIPFVISAQPEPAQKKGKRKGGKKRGNKGPVTKKNGGGE